MAVLGTGQLLLILGWNRQLGIPDFVFALGDDALTQVIEAMFFVGFFVAVLLERALSTGT